MNWDNLIRCSNYFGIPPEEFCPDGSYGYEAYAVQRGIKPATTFRYRTSSPEVKHLIENLPRDCIVLPYKEENTTFICHKCKLSDIFNLNEIKRRYDLFGIFEVDWDKVDNYFKNDLSFFADNTISGIKIEDGADNNTEYIVVGALLGYPIESTVAAIHRTKKLFHVETQNSAQRHFKTNIEPFVDMRGQTWLKIGEHIFIDGQQEELYY